MRKIVLRFGLYGTAVMLVILVISFFVFKGRRDFDVEEIIGYTTIVVSLLFVYFGIRHWRDNYNMGLLSFGQGFKLGTMITLPPSIAFGLLTLLETTVLDPDFNEKYYDHYIQNIKATTPPDKLQAVLQKMEAEKEMFSNPFIQFAIMFLTVFLIGLVVTVISSLILQRTSSKSKMATAA